MRDSRFITIDTRMDIMYIESRAQEITNLIATGWEIISSTATENVVFYILRKEKNA